MAEDAGGAGSFPLGSAYVQVDPNAETFAEQLEEQLAGVDLVVTVPVVADAAGLQESVDAAAAEAKATVVVPVTADPAGLPESVDAAARESGAAVTVPLEADPANLAAQADEAAIAAGEEAGGTFAEKFSSVASSTSLFTPDEGTMAGAGAAAGDAAGAGFSEGFTAASASAGAGIGAEITPEATAAGVEAGAGLGDAFSAAVTRAVQASSAAWGEIPVAAGDAAASAVAVTAEAWGALVPAAATEGSAAGAAAGEGFVSRLGAMLSGVTSMFTGLIPAAAAEGAAAGESAGEGFTSRFAAMMSGVTGAFSGLIPGMAAEGEAGGTAAGEGFATRFKSIISGSISPMEALMGAGFVAVAADMASKFQAAMEMIHTQAGVAQSAIAGLSGQVLTLAGKVGESPDSLAQALYHVESSFQSVGISGQKAMALLQVAAEGARAGNANLVDVTNALDATIASGVGGINNYSQAMGALNAIVGSGDMTMQDLADAMGTGLMAAGKAYGQSIYQIGAALATFGDNNIRGAKAATDLRMAWQAVEAPMKGGIPVLNQLGLSANQLASEMTQHGLTGALQMFVDHLESSKVPVNQWGQIVTEVFGKRAGVGIQVLIDQLDRVKGKLPDITNAAHSFGSAWAATQATTSQKFRELEAGLDALMIKIGAGLLPAVDGFMSMVTRNLPTIERLGSEIAHLAAPVVTGFFHDLEATLKELFGPLRTVTEAVLAGIAAFMAIKEVLAVIESVKLAWLALQTTLLANPFVAIAAAVVALAVVIIKYHQQIWEAIKKTWDDVASFFAGLYDKIARPVEKIFDDIRKYITTGFDKWWKSHGEELEAVWKAIWTAIKLWFTLQWDFISAYLKAGFDVLKGIVETGLDVIETGFRTTWDAIQLVVKTAWDLMAATFKVALAAIEVVLKTTWDVIVGIFSVFLDLVTGHWSKAWTDIKNTAEQVWNAIKAFLAGVWGAISTAVEQVVGNLIRFFTSAWADIKSGVTTAFNDIKNTVLGVWNDILSGIEAVVNKIKGIISDITGGVGHVVGSVLGSIGIHFARGGVIPGYAPGHDSVNAKLSPGEAVLVPEAVRAIGPGTINAINAHYSAGRGSSTGGYSGGGVVPDPYSGTAAAGGYAFGGIFPYGGMQPYGGQEPYQGAGTTTSSSGGVNNFYVSFSGARPTTEEMQAVKIQLATAVGAAG